MMNLKAITTQTQAAAVCCLMKSRSLLLWPTPDSGLRAVSIGILFETIPKLAGYRIVGATQHRCKRLETLESNPRCTEQRAGGRAEIMTAMPQIIRDTLHSCLNSSSPTPERRWHSARQNNPEAARPASDSFVNLTRLAAAKTCWYRFELLLSHDIRRRQSDMNVLQTAFVNMNIHILGNIDSEFLINHGPRVSD